MLSLSTARLCYLHYIYLGDDIHILVHTFKYLLVNEASISEYEIDREQKGEEKLFCASLFQRVRINYWFSITNMLCKTKSQLMVSLFNILRKYLLKVIISRSL